MTQHLDDHWIGRSPQRLDGPAKLTGSAPYAYEQPVDRPCFVHPVQATIARGRVSEIQTAAAESLDGVIAVMTRHNAPELADTSDRELAILQTADVAFRGQLIGAVIAESPEIARQAADLVQVTYRVDEHDVELSAERNGLYAPEEINAGAPSDTNDGDVDAAVRAAAVTIDQSYTTPTEHNNPMEPHTTIAHWQPDGSLTLFDSTQGVHPVRTTIAPILGLEPEQISVIAPHVGGGFGSKGVPHAHLMLAAMAATRSDGRPVKLALTRQQMFSLVGYRTPTIQRVRLAADRDGRLQGISIDVVEQTSTIKEFVEQTGAPTRMMYAAPNRSTTHRVAALDVPVPSWMRAPGECPGMFGPEVAMDELAHACGLDPIELRIRNEPDVDPETGHPWSSRLLVQCLQEGAARFGWQHRDPLPARRLEHGWWIGTGVASAVYPTMRQPGSAARIRFELGRYQVSIGAADLGTGTWTALTQIAADTLGVGIDDVSLQIGDTALPMATVAGGSSGITSWGSAIWAAAERFRTTFGTDPEDGDELTEQTPANPAAERLAMYAFGAQFAEVRVNADTGELRVPRMLGVFDAGRIINPRMARSQFIGGMTMGISMALHEQSIMDPRFGHIINHDFAEYHIATNADVGDIEAIWLDHADLQVNPMGSKGIGEIGIVGAAAAVANAAYHATGVRVRDLPLSGDKFLF